MRIAFDMLIVEWMSSEAQQDTCVLLNELATLSAHHYIIITGRPEMYSQHKQATNISLYPVNIGAGRGILTRHQLLLPALLRRIQPDILHIPDSVAPIGWDRPFVVTMHTLAMLAGPFADAQPHGERMHRDYWQHMLRESLQRAHGIIMPFEYLTYIERIMSQGGPADTGTYMHGYEDKTRALAVLHAYQMAQHYQGTGNRTANEPASPSGDATYPSVSIIIPASRPAKAEQALAALSHQSYAGQSEIIMVGPPARELAARWPIRAVHPEALYTPGKARNLGAAQAHGELLLFLDDDMLVASDWIEQNIQALRQPGVGAVGARMPGKARTFYARCADLTNYGHYQHTHMREELLGAGSMGIHRTLFVELGGFDEGLRAGEDVELCQRIQQRGYRTLYQPEIVVIHDHDYDTLGKLLRYNYTHGRQGGSATQTRPGTQGIQARIITRVIQQPLLFLSLLPLLALAGAIRIASLNRSDHKYIMLYFPAILLGKVAYQAGVFMSLVKDREGSVRNEEDSRATDTMDATRRVPHTHHTETREKLQTKEYRENLWHRLQTYMRRRRFHFVRGLLATLPAGYKLLDVGGTPEFWRQVQFSPEDGAIVLYNLQEGSATEAGITHMPGDGRDMREFPDKHFDAVFSNSVIEHVGTYQQQRQMAREIQRVGRRYCVQTPNRYFPIEPHVLWPCFQFLPRRWQIAILVHSRSPWGWRIASEQEAERYVSGIRLLSAKELRALFPGARLHREKFLGLTKSFLIYHGW